MRDIEIVICTHNRAAALDATLNCLAQQELRQRTWSVLVVDNASTDRTAEVIAAHRATGALPGLRGIYEGKPGLTAARQRGVQEARGVRVAFVDDDCHLGPGWIGAALAAFDRLPNAVAVGGAVHPVWRKGIPKGLRAQGWIFAEQSSVTADREVSSLVGAGMVVDRAALCSTGWSDAALIDDRTGRGATSGGDVEIGLRLRAGGGGLYLVPGMQLSHLIDPDRQNGYEMRKLAAGLGAGSVLVGLLEADEELDCFLRRTNKEIRGRRRSLLLSFLRGRFRPNEWRIFDAFEAGRVAKTAELSDNRNAADRLLGKIGRIPTSQP
ncbi:MAG: glycosyltransferase family 2 protein [Rhodobacteraceae bacterium]|nr:glycosyltransferase family 2 protein [Paracoccaceae bacterium]